MISGEQFYANIQLLFNTTRVSYSQEEVNHMVSIIEKVITFVQCQYRLEFLFFLPTHFLPSQLPGCSYYCTWNELSSVVFFST